MAPNQSGRLDLHENEIQQLKESIPGQIEMLSQNFEERMNIMMAWFQNKFDVEQARAQEAQAKLLEELQGANSPKIVRRETEDNRKIHEE